MEVGPGVSVKYVGFMMFGQRLVDIWADEKKTKCWRISTVQEHLSKKRWSLNGSGRKRYREHYLLFYQQQKSQ